MSLKIPVLSILIGEGGSGGALALAVANEVWMLENAISSVISPEGCASILWRDAKRAADAAECLRLTAQDGYALGVTERVFPESEGFDVLYQQLQDALYDYFSRCRNEAVEDIVRRRYDRFRRIGTAQCTDAEETES
jgi:acetyl-CoA carboxylase carboxyl transferase subunit alpha